MFAFFEARQQKSKTTKTFIKLLSLIDNESLNTDHNPL